MISYFKKYTPHVHNKTHPRLILGEKFRMSTLFLVRGKCLVDKFWGWGGGKIPCSHPLNETLTCVVYFLIRHGLLHGYFN